MKALTLHQPWATCVALHGKRVENRTWTPPDSILGQRIAIHAGKKLDSEAYEMLLEEGVELHLATSLPRGAVVATARVRGWVRSDNGVTVRDAVLLSGVPEQALNSTWWAGPVGWVLDDVKDIEPVQCSGAQGLWTLPADVARIVQEREDLWCL